MFRSSPSVFSASSTLSSSILRRCCMMTTRNQASSASATSKFFLSNTCTSNKISAATVSSSSFMVSQYSSFHSLSLEQAMRLTSPSYKHPATGEPSADAASKPAPLTPTTTADVEKSGGDPATLWREHWDVEFERPYYHNLVTNEVRTTLPDGFPTRFLFYYQRMKGGVRSEPSDAGRSPEHATRAKTMKERIKDFGLAGFLLYGFIHFGMLTIIFLIMLAGVDVRGIMKKIGIDVGSRLKGDQSIWAVWLVAILVNKVFVPVQLLATASLAPKVAPILKNFLIRFGFRA